MDREIDALFEDIIDEPDAGGAKDVPKWDKRPVNHVAFVLDCSGSMNPIAEKSMWSFNEQLQELRKESYDQDTFVTLVMFNSTVTVEYLDKNITEVEELKHYPASGMTALYDAIGLTINELKSKVKKDNNHSALMFIITDGDENFSSSYSGEIGRKTIKSEIEKLEGEGNWTFVFLGANIDVKKVAETGFAMASANTMDFSSTGEGVETYTLSNTSGIKDYYAGRRSGQTQTQDFFSGTSGTAGGKTSDSSNVQSPHKILTTGGGNLDGSQT